MLQNKVEVLEMLNIRGFDQRNIAVMINGVPVNDMENGAVYWSNWAGLSDVTSVQVQRGLGSSKLAISSVGVLNKCNH
jgi:outer membrane cobalamin receptor